MTNDLKIKEIQEKIEILKTCKTANETTKSINGWIAQSAYDATYANDKEILAFYAGLEDTTKSLIKGSVSKGKFVALAALDEKIPSDIANDSILTIYNKLKKIEKVQEAAKQENRVRKMHENHALQQVFTDKESLSDFLTNNKPDSQLYQDALQQGFAILASEESKVKEMETFLKLESDILALSKENLEKIFVLVSAKMAVPAKKRA